MELMRKINKLMLIQFLKYRKKQDINQSFSISKARKFNKFYKWNNSILKINYF
jgi:hypothetical protein